MRDRGVKTVVAAFNQEKALAGAFSVIVKTDGLSAALVVRGSIDMVRVRWNIKNGPSFHDQ